MIYLNAFIFCGSVCLLGQILLDNTKFTPGHVTSLFVIIGCLLDSFNIYDKFILFAGGGALVPITSFGHLLIHGAISNTTSDGILGLCIGMFNLTSAGIMSAIVFSFIFALFFKPKN